MKKLTINKPFFLILISLLVVLHCPSATGQDGEWTVYNYFNTAYRNMRVDDMLVDDSGNVWVGGNFLKKFDGIKWTIYTFKYNSNKTYLAVDSQNHLWISTTRSSNPPQTDLFMFDGTTWIEHNGYKEIMPNMGAITGLAIDENDVVWLGTNHRTNYFDEGILRYDGSSWSLFDATNSPLPDSTAITYVESDPTGGVWFGSWHGILYVKDRVWEYFDDQNAPLPEFSGVNYFDVTPDGVFWAAISGHGLKSYDGEQWQSFPLYGGNSRGIGIDHLNRIWVGGDNGTFVFFDETWHQGSEIINDYSDILPGTKTGWSGFCSVSDHNGNIWLTGGGELICYDPVSGEILFDSREPHGLPPNNQISDIAISSNGTAWVATYYGLASFDGNTWNTYRPESSPLPNSMVHCLAIDTNDVVWAGTERGLVRIDNNNWTVYTTENSALPTDHIKHVAVDSHNTIWLATDQDGGMSSLPPGYGIVSFDGTDWSIYTTDNSGIPDNRVSALAIDANDNVWIGSSFPYLFSAYYSKGIAKFDGSEWEVFNSESSGLGCDKVTDIAIAEDGAVWVSTFEYQETWNGEYIKGGLYSFKDGLWRSYTTENSGLRSNSIALVSADSNGTIWLGYKEELGLSSFDGKNWELVRYSENGLPSNFISCIAEAPNGDLWIGTFPQDGDSFVRIDGIGVYSRPELLTSINNNEQNPGNYEILTLNNYPNPFNPQTTISFELLEPSHITLSVHSVTGQRVAVLVDDYLHAGTHSVIFNSRNLASGVYFYRLETGAMVKTKKMLLVR